MMTKGKDAVKDKRKKVVLMCLGLACIIVYAIWAAQVAGIIHLGAHRIVTEVEQPVFDFGEVAVGSTRSHTFVLRNTGRDTINIKKLVSECACTATILSNKEILPKQEVQIEIRLKTTGYFGKLQKKCLVLFEQENVMPVKLEVVADIYSPTANLSTNRVHFDKVVAGSKAMKIVTVIEKEHLDERLTIESVKSSSNLIKVDYDDSKGEIRCVLDSNAPIGFFDEKIFVTMIGPKGVSNVEIPVAGRVVYPYELNPERIFLGSLRKIPEQQVKRIVTITNLKGGIPTDFDPTVDDENVSLKVKSRDDNRVVCSLEFNLPPKSGFFEGEFLINTNSRDAGSIEALCVPYSGYCIAR